MAQDLQQNRLNMLTINGVGLKKMGICGSIIM